MIRYAPQDWYWIVAGSATQVYSSKRSQYVPTSDAQYQAWLVRNNKPTRIPSESDLWDVLAKQFPEGVAAGNAAGQDLVKTQKVNGMTEVFARAMREHENRIRVLENLAVNTSLTTGRGVNGNTNRQPVTMAQVVQFLKGLL